MLTTRDAAAQLGTALRNVQNYCKRHGLQRFGREYVITPADVEAMKAEISDKPGPRPRAKGET